MTLPTGWCPGIRAGESEVTATQRQLAEYPGTQVIRKFFSGQLGGWVGALSLAQPGQTVVVSYHGFQAPILQFAEAIPPGVFVKASPYHEFEKKLTPAQLLGEFRHLDSVIPRDHPLRAEGILQFGPTATVYRARIGAPGDLRRFLTPELLALVDFVAWDWYPSNPAERTPTNPAAYEPPESAFALMLSFAEEAGLPWGFSEFNHEDISQTSASHWYRSAHAYAKEHGCRWWAHFHRGGGDLTSPTTPRPEMAAALRDLIAQEVPVAWYLNPALTNFRDAVNAAYPTRDKASDGTIGDPAHQARDSDHNPDSDGSVDAWDMDVDLRSGDDPAAVEMLKRVFEAHESSRYWIHNRQIASRLNDWVREPYGGDNPHDKHVHWNTREAYENSNDPWEIDMPLTEADADLVVTRLLGRLMGRSGPTVGVALQGTYGAVRAIAEKVDLDPAELEAIKTAAREGAAAAADELVAAVVANLPEGTSLTKADVEQAVRDAFAGGLAPDA